MVAKRIAALLAAVALVAIALLVRRGVIEGDDDDEPDPPAATTDVMCIRELTAVCTQLARDHPELTVTIDDAGDQLDRLAALDEGAPAPAWITIEPYPAMVDSLRAASGRPPLAAPTTVLGAARVAVAVPSGGRAATLDAHCAGTALWRCLGDEAGAPWESIGGEVAWGTVRPSLGDVEGTAAGLASFAVAVGGYVGRADYASADWQAQASFIPWLRRLSDAAGAAALSGGTPLATMVTRPSALDVAATDDAELAATGGTYEVRYPEPSMWLQAVLAEPGGQGVDADVETDLTAVLTASGWAAPSTAAQPLPGASTMLALRALWAEAT